MRALAILGGLALSLLTLQPSSAQAGGLARKRHVIKAGDTLHELAQRYGCTVRDLRRANELGEVLPLGKILTIPACGQPAHEARLDPRVRRNAEPRGQGPGKALTAASRADGKVDGKTAAKSSPQELRAQAASRHVDELRRRNEPRVPGHVPAPAEVTASKKRPAPADRAPADRALADSLATRSRPAHPTPRAVRAAAEDAVRSPRQLAPSPDGPHAGDAVRARDGELRSPKAAAVEPPTEAPTETPTEAPTEVPTDLPVEVPPAESALPTPAERALPDVPDAAEGTDAGDASDAPRGEPDVVLTTRSLKALTPAVSDSVDPVAGQSLGLPWRGHLQAASRLPAGEGYVLRRPHRTWGTETTVAHVREAIAELRRKFPTIHELAIGDLSAEHGGPISDHRSHQSGRDIDIGLVFLRKPAGYPDAFVVGTEATLHAAATWALISAFAETSELDGGATMIFLDYAVQAILYRWALAEGVDQELLGRIFQYPHGKRAAVGLVRHAPNHADHLHVRFRCGANEPGCL